jgi:hypothetical protein
MWMFSLLWFLRCLSGFALLYTLYPARLVGDRSWEKVIDALIDFPSESGQHDAAGCRIDIHGGRLVGCDGTASVDAPAELINDMVATGILLSVETEFGEKGVAINLGTVNWDMSVTLGAGSTDPLQHTRDRSMDAVSCCKLSCIMMMGSVGWKASDDCGALGYFCHGAPREFALDVGRPKSYFWVLAKADEILGKLGVLESLPVIHHGMKDSYYKVLLRLTSGKDLAKLDALMATAADVKALPDKDFAALLPEQGEEEPCGVEVQDEDAVLAPLLDRPLQLQNTGADMNTLHSNASAVLRGLPRESIDLRSSMTADVHDHRLVVHFDNFSHSSGKQRCYIACPSPFHKACFKYAVVDKFPSKELASAWLMLWADHARRQPRDFTKKDHERHVPGQEAVEELAAAVATEPV